MLDSKLLNNNDVCLELYRHLHNNWYMVNDFEKRTVYQNFVKRIKLV